jgi:hypothetical protein
MGRIVWDDERLREIAAESVRRGGAAVAGIARATAPRRTGAGAASIHNWQAGQSQRIGWDGAHNYLRFQDYVHSRHGYTTHFLERALESYRG